MARDQIVWPEEASSASDTVRGGRAAYYRNDVLAKRATLDTALTDLADARSAMPAGPATASTASLTPVSYDPVADFRPFDAAADFQPTPGFMDTMRSVAADPSLLVQGLRDTIPGGGGRPNARRADQVILNPQGATEHVVSGMVTAPLTMAGGAGLGLVAGRLAPAVAKTVAPTVGRILTSGGVGAAAGAQRGDDPLTAGAIGAGAGAVGELVPAWLAAKQILKLPILGSIPGVGKGAEGARAFDAVADTIKDAFLAIAPRITYATGRGGRWINSTVLGRNLTPVEAAERLAQTHGARFDLARKELMAAFDAIDSSSVRMLPNQTVVPGPRPYAGDLFGARVPEVRELPSEAARAWESIRQALTSPVTRSVTETAAGQRNAGDSVPYGAYAALGLGSAAQGAGHGIGNIARGIFGGGH